MIITILKRKGGVGASTLAVGIAGELLTRYSRDYSAKRTLILDCDPQHSTKAWSEYGDSSAPSVLAEASVPVDTDSPSEFRSILTEHERNRHLIIDCAPGFPVTAVAAAAAADIILIPCGPSPLDLEPAADALEVAFEAKRQDAGRRIGLVPSKNLPRTRLGRELPQALKKLGASTVSKVMPGISQRVAVAEAVLSGQTIQEYEPEGPSAQEFQTLVEELLKWGDLGHLVEG